MTDTVNGRQVRRDAGYQRSLEVHDQIEALYPRVEKYGAYFRSLMPVDPTLPHPPGIRAGTRLDPLVCALAIKASTTKRAVLSLCELCDGDNAVALARVLLENACLLEWLIRGEGRRRLETYAMFLSVVHERVVETIERHKGRFISAGADPKVSSEAYHRAIRTHVFVDTKRRPTRSDRATWDFDRVTGAGQPVNVAQLFREVASASESFEYDMLYGAFGSDIVHSGPFSLAHTLRAMDGRKTFLLRPTPNIDLCTIALASSNTAMFLVLDSLTEYLGLDLSADLEPLKAKSQVDPHANNPAASNP